MENTSKLLSQHIEKEEISQLHFASANAVATHEEHKLLQHALDRACREGNEFKSKVKIVFVSESGRHEVHTTIWNVSDDAISLKGGVVIPTRCIQSIEYL